MRYSYISAIRFVMISEGGLKTISKSRFSWVLLFIGAVFLVYACTLTREDGPDQTISFNRIYDSLAQFDSVQIVMKDTGGHTIDNLYHGKVDSISEIMDLPAPHWDGGLVLISIYGYKAGELVYHMDRKFNGANDKSIDTTYVVLPNTRLEADDLNLTLFEGDTSAFPAISVSPDSLKDKTIQWTSDQSLVLAVTPKGLISKKTGSVQLTARLVSNPTKLITFSVTIVKNPKVPATIAIIPDSLILAAAGAPAKASIKVAPTSADASVTWEILDSSIAKVESDGVVHGLKKGVTRLWAYSKKKTDVSDTVNVFVTDPAPVEKVHFLDDSLDIFIGGAAESLSVEVLPSKANQTLSFRIVDSSLVSLKNGKALAIAIGKTLVIAQSAENPEKKDTLRINVLAPEKINGVTVNPDSLRLYTRGVGGKLAGSVLPASANQTLKWRSGNETIVSVDANGLVSPMSVGRTSVTAISRVDSSKQAEATVVVKRDVPQLFVGRDTVIGLGKTVTRSPHVTQEYGKVVEFKWDLNGDGAWDGASDSVQSVSYQYDIENEYITAFYVRDSEGNDTTVLKKVRAVRGPAVVILSPKDSTYTTSMSIDVSWSVNGAIQDSLVKQSLKVGNNTISRTAKDEAGNAYTASVTVFVDTAPPLKPIVHGPRYASTKTPTWTWASGGLGGAGKYKIALDVNDPAPGNETSDTSFTPTTPLSEGTHTLSVIERDLAGNWSTVGKLSIIVDVTKPPVPDITSEQVSPTNISKPIWNWSGGEAGGSFEVKLDNNVIQPTGALSYSPSTELSEGKHTLFVRAKDSASNLSDYASMTLFVDRNNPTITIDGANPRTSGSTTLSISGTVGDGTGAGVKGVSISGAVSGNGAATVSGSTWSKSGLTLNSGANTVSAVATDSAGRTTTISLSVSVNVAISAVVITSPPKGYVTNASNVVIKYKIDNGPEQSVNKALTEGQNSFDIVSSPNELGQTGKDNILVYSRTNVIFVREGGEGKKDGSSWEDAIGDLNSAIISENEGKEIWVANGTYPGFVGYSGVKMLGGFDAANHQNDSAGRSKSIVGGFRIRGLMPERPDLGNTSSMDGFSFACYVNVNQSDLTISNSQFLQGSGCGGISVDGGGRLTLNNLQMKGITFPTPALSIAADGGTVTINGGEFSNNTSSDCLMKMEYGYLVLNGPVIISGNTNTNPIPGFGSAIFWEVDGRLDVNEPVVLPESGGLYWEGGRYYYHGNRIH